MNTPNRAPVALPVVFALFVVSGATGLLYEVLWLRQLTLIFGSTLFATSAVLATFMAGLALGAYAAGRVFERRGLRPLRLYGLLEIGIALYALAVPSIFERLSPLYRLVWEWGGAESYVLMSLAKFAGILIVLLPPTALMGASLPILARVVADDPLRIGGKVGALYATNTFGAVLGTFLGGFVAIPRLGVQTTIVCTAAVNVAVGLAALILAAREAVYPAPAPARRGERPTRDPGVRLALVAFGLSGFAAMVLEIAWTRGLALVMGSSVYAFALMLLAFLVGLASGSAAFSALLRRPRGPHPGTLLALLLAVSGVLAYGTAYLVQLLPRLFAEAYLAWQPSVNGMFAIELALGLVVMFPTTFALGGVFPAVLQIHARTLESVPSSVGTVYASNTLGTIFGAFAGGFVLIPGLGVRDTLLAMSALEILLGVLTAWTVAAGSRRRRLTLAAAIAAAAAVLPLARPSWDDLLMNSGVYYYIHDVPRDGGWREFARRAREDQRIAYLAEGLTSTVIVVDQPKHRNRYLSVNGKVEASSQSDVETQIMCSHLPLLFHPDPQDVLVIGLASGITVGAAASHPVHSVRVVEVEKAMVGAARMFDPWNGNVLDDPRVTVSINDARNDLEFSSRQYDVIVSQPSNPFMTVAANLFTEDFFKMARGRLRPGGLFSQWVQAYCLPPDDLRSVIAAFRAAFPEVWLFQIGHVDLILVGSDRPLRFDLEALDRRMSELTVLTDLARVGVSSAMDLLPLFELGDEDVDRLVQGASPNTDDNARVEYSAPKAFMLQTTGMNWDMLEEYGGEPLDYLADPPRTEEEQAVQILELARAWRRRGEPETAADYARMVLDGALRAEAEAFLRDLGDGSGTP